MGDKVIRDQELLDRLDEMMELYNATTYKDFCDSREDFLRKILDYMDGYYDRNQEITSFFLPES